MSIEGRLGHGRTPAPSGSVLYVLCRQFQEFEPHLVHTRMNQSDSPGDTIGYINFTPLLVRTTVIDAYKFKLSGASVHHADQGPKGEVRVGGGESFRVEDLAVSSLAPIEPGAIPAGVAYPGFDRLNWLIQVRNQRSFHRRSDEEHEEHPTKRGPKHEESMSHSVFFLLLNPEKCSRKTSLCQPFSATNLSFISFKVNSLARSRTFVRASESRSLAFGSAKLAVPT